MSVNSPRMDRKLSNRLVNESPLVNPLSIILVKNGSKGDRLLFRYPFTRVQVQPGPEPSPRLTPNQKFIDSFGYSDFKTPASTYLQPSSAFSFPQKSALSRYPNSGGSSIGIKSPLAKSSPIAMAGSLKNPQTIPTPASSMKSVRIVEDDKDNLSSVDSKSNLSIASTSSGASVATVMSAATIGGGPKLTPMSASHLQSSKQTTRTLWEDTPRIGLGNDILSDLTDKDLSNLLAVTSELTEKKFELKINEVRFVGHPTLMQHPNMRDYYSNSVTAKQTNTTVKLFHIVFCVKAMASHSIVKCFYDLSKRLGVGLRHEEYRCNYLSTEMRKIVAMLDDASHHQENLGMGSGVDHDNIMEDNYFTHLAAEILAQSSLAQLLKQVYDDVCQTGFVKLKVNNWVQISFSLPQKIHVLPYRNPPPIVEPENIHKCLEAIRPYHALLLLVDREELVGSFDYDAASTIPRLIQVYSPLKSLQMIAADADLTLGHVVEIASHLVYWSMATIIYPICETNVYVVAPDAPISSELTEMDDAFLDRFPGLSLSQTLSDFSVPSQLGELINPVLGGPYVQSQVVQLVCWLLQNHLLIQLHTYVYMNTYLDHTMNLGSDCNNSGQFLLDGNLSLCPPYFELGEEDEITMSDSYSETTGDDIGMSPIPPHHHSSTLSASESSTTTLVGGSQNSSQSGHTLTHNLSHGEDVVDGISSTSTSSARNLSLPLDTDDHDHTDNDHGSGIGGGLAPMEKLKGTLDELADPVRRALLLVKQPISIHDIKVFSRISKYFNGEYHLEEIMYMENMRRSQVLLILDKFRDVLITVEKEDADINFFKSDSWVHEAKAS